MGLKPHRSVDIGTLLIDITVDPLTSSVMDFTGYRSGYSEISIDGPTALTGAVRLQVTNEKEANVDLDVHGTVWRDKQSAGADIVIPADGHVTIKAVDFARMRLLSDTIETADRRFRVRGTERES